MSYHIRLLIFSLFGCVGILDAQPAADAGSLIAVVYNDGDNYLCPHSPYQPSMFCNLRRAIQYMIGAPEWIKYTKKVLGLNGPICPEECPSKFYTEIKLSLARPYLWNYARPIRVMNKIVRIQAKRTPEELDVTNVRAVIEGYEVKSDYKDYDYIDAGFLFVGADGLVELTMIEFRNFHRLSVPALYLNFYVFPHTSVTRGGVLQLNGGKLSLKYCNFRNNTANYGGAVHIDTNPTIKSDLQVSSGCTFEDNHATQNGGAINADSEYMVSIRIGTKRPGGWTCPDPAKKVLTDDGILTINKLLDCGAVFIHNTARYHGGAVSFWNTHPVGRTRDTKLDVEAYCSFSNNEAGVDGGSIYLHHANVIDIGPRIKFKANTAEFGAAIYMHTLGDVQFLPELDFEQNTAKECGGTIYFNKAGAEFSISPGVNLQGFSLTAQQLAKKIEILPKNPSNNAGNKYKGGNHGGCPGAFFFDDGSFGVPNCTEGLNCSVWGYDATGFPQKATLGIVDFKKSYNCSEYKDLTGKDRICEIDCLLFPDSPKCVDELDQCVSQPCSNGAECIDRKYAYRCVCVPGWEGEDCSKDVDDCAVNYCQNQATCVDGPAPNPNGTYTCTCPHGWKGDYCQEVDTDEIDFAQSSFSLRSWLMLYGLLSSVVFTVI